MDHIYLFIAKLFPLAFGFFIYAIHRFLDKRAILEVGYRSQRQRKIAGADKQLPRWDRYLMWSLMKNAKKDHKIVRIYWGLHILACIGLMGSVCLFLWPTSLENWRKAISFQLRFPQGVFVVHMGLRSVLDLLFLPSEQKRYGIRKDK